MKLRRARAALSLISQYKVTDQAQSPFPLLYIKPSVCAGGHPRPSSPPLPSHLKEKQRRGGDAGYCPLRKAR